jgi:hypothetical protein
LQKNGAEADPDRRQAHSGGRSFGENSPPGEKSGLEFAARPLTYQRFRQNAVS